MSITKDDVVKFIEGMTVLELSALVKELEEKFGVSAAAPMMAAVAARVPPPPLRLKKKPSLTRFSPDSALKRFR